VADPAHAPRRQSALGELPASLRPGGLERPAVAMHERAGLLIRQIAAWRDAEIGRLRALLRERLGIDLPDGPDAIGAGGGVALRVAPRRWWLVEAPDEGEDADLAAAIAGHAALVDLSHARTVLRLDGPACRSVLAKLCRIDLHARALPPGRVVQTALGQVAALIHVLGDAPGFDLYLPRSLAASGVASVIDAAEEFLGGTLG
jgi:methylglutamate dehydrogenase subunit D